MSIQDYLRILRRRGWIVVLAVVLAGAAAFGVSSLQEEMYRATVQVSTVPARPDWGLGNTAKKTDAQLRHQYPDAGGGPAGDRTGAARPEPLHFSQSGQSHPRFQHL